MVLGAALAAQGGSNLAGASTLPTGFRDSVVLSGLTNPTVLQFAPDGRIFVGQKNGVIKVFQSLTDTNPVTVADLSNEVDDYWDRGLLGLAIPPDFPANPYIYVLYTYDAPPGTAWPDHRRLRRIGARVAAADQREHHDRQRASARQRLVPAVPQPLDRHAVVRARRRPLCRCR
jgi:glucose/arabinose dehydrogenase